MSPDTWDDGATYEPYMGRWSKVMASRFLSWLAIPGGAAWLDFGCGTGALSRSILADASPRLVIGCDRSPGYVHFARTRIADRRAQFMVAELPELPHIQGGFDAVVSGLVLNFLPAPLEGVTAMMARVRPGGTVAAYLWDYAEGMQLIRTFWDAAVGLDPAARGLDESRRFPLCRPEPLGQLFEAAQLRRVTVDPIEVPTVFQTFEDYWTPFLGGQGPAPGYAMGLTVERRTELREALRRRLPGGPDGAIALTAKAWAVKGTAA